MNRLFQTDGIVLKSIKLNESDKIVTIFSQNYGKIRVIAKGVRKTKSQFGSSMENLTMAKILAYRGKNLNTVSQTEIINSFFSQCKDLNRYGLAIQCAEIIDKITADEDPNDTIFQLFKDVLILLKNDQNPVLLVESFKWKLIDALGYQPSLNQCVDCNKKVKKSQYYIFDIQKGGIICHSCQNTSYHNKIEITDYCLRLLKRIKDADLMMIHNKKIIQSALFELIKITDYYISYHFEIKYRTKQFLNKIKFIE